MEFWPYCQQKMRRDLSNLKRSKVIHTVGFIAIAITLTYIEQRKIAAVFSTASLIQGVRLVGEIFADRILGISIFKGGQ